MKIEAIARSELRDPVKLEESDRQKKFQLATTLSQISITRQILDDLKKAQDLKKSPHVDG